MKKIIKYRLAIFAAWLAATILLVAFQPDVNAILRSRGQQPLGKDSPPAGNHQKPLWVKA